MPRFVMPVVACLCLVASISGAAFSMHLLDQRAPKSSFQEMMYLPDGKGLKILAMGFDAPVADMVFLQSLLYFSNNIQAQAKGNREARYRYLAKAFHVATTLSPRFHEAYYNGGLLLSAANYPAQAITLLKRGFEAFPDDWRFPVHEAVICSQQLKDLSRARQAMEKAAAVPGIPELFFKAVDGIIEAGSRNTSLAQQRANLITYWEAVYHDTKQPEQLRTYAENHLRELYTATACEAVSEAAAAFLVGRSRPARSLDELVDGGFLAEKPQPYLEGDAYLLLPDGRCLSRIFATRSVEGMLVRMEHLIKKYQKKNGHYPTTLQDMLDAKLLHSLPTHPLAGWGYRFDYDPATGLFSEGSPESHE